MVVEILARFEVIEECYEFMLAYAAQGLTQELSRVRVVMRHVAVGPDA